MRLRSDRTVKMEKENLRKQNNLKEEDLKQKCSQEHREEMKKFISWESVGPYLSRIDVINMRDIRKDGEGEEGKRRLLIDKWEELNGNGATYDDMITATLKAKKREEAEKVCRLVKSTHAPECNSCDDGRETDFECPSDGELRKLKDAARDLMDDLDRLLDDVSEFILSIEPFPAEVILRKIYIKEIICREEHRKELKTKSDIDGFLKVLTEYKYITFYYVDVLEIIIKCCKKEMDDKDKIDCEEYLKTYKQKLGGHLKTRISENRKFHNSVVPPSVNTEEVIIFTDEMWDKNLPHWKLYSLQKLLMDALGCRNICLKNIYTGCIVLCFSIPPQVHLMYDFEADEHMLLKLINVGVSALRERNEDRQIERFYKNVLDEHKKCSTLFCEHSPSWKGDPNTEENIFTLVKKSLVPVDGDWGKTSIFFEIESGKKDYFKEIARVWSQKMTHSADWGKLGLKIIRSCNESDIEIVHNRMKNAVSYNKEDAPLRLAYKLLEDLSNLPQELAFITRYTEEEFGYFLEKYPHAITWKSIAIGLYKLEQNEHLEKLFKLLKSPEDLTLIFSEVETVLMTVDNFQSLCLELHSVPPPPRSVSYSKAGVMLWLLTSPLRTWMDLAWGLYRSHQDPALKKAKSHITVSDDVIVGEEKALSFLEQTEMREGKLINIAKYLRERKSSGKSIKSQDWLHDWSQLYPCITGRVLYQALIFGGEHALARKVLLEYEVVAVDEDIDIESMWNTVDGVSSWPKFVSELQRLKPQVIEQSFFAGVRDATEPEIKKLWLAKYMRLNKDHVKDIAKAGYISMEYIVLERLVTSKADYHIRKGIHDLVIKHIRKRSGFNELYNAMLIPSLGQKMPDVAGIDLWLLTCPFSWRELAWAFHKCKLPKAVIEIKHEFIKDDSLSLMDDEILDRKELLSLLGGASERGESEWLDSDPNISWCLLMSALLRAQNESAAVHIANKYHIKGCLMTKRNVEKVVKVFLLRDSPVNAEMWKQYAVAFGASLSDKGNVSDMEKVSILCEYWYKKEPFPVWWELGDTLYRCCENWIDDIRLLMRNVNDLHYINDAVFEVKIIMEALSDLNEWESFYFMVTGNQIFQDFPEFQDTLEHRQRSLGEFMRERPGKITWKDLAEAAYLCGEESVLHKLSHYMKSPDDPTLSYEVVKELLNRHGLTKVHYAGINAELGVPLLLKKCANTFGIRLWLLRDPSVTWSDLAIALYNIYTKPTDAALDELIHKYLPNEDSSFTSENLKQFSKVENWKMLGYLIGDRNSQDAYQAFQTKHGDAPETLLIEWKQKHPYASWTLLYQGLKTINEVNLAEKIKETYLSDHDRKIDIVAMSGTFSGAPRSGKTTVIRRLKGETVDIKQMTPSTGVVDDRGAISINILPSCNIVTDQDWVEMEEEDEVQAFLNLTIIPVKEEPKSELAYNEVKVNKPQTQHLQDVGASPPTTVLTYPIDPPETKHEQYDPDLEQPEPVIGPRKSYIGPSKTVTEAPETVTDYPQTVTQLQVQEVESVVSGQNNEDKTEPNLNELPSPRDVLNKALVHSQQIRATKQLSRRHFLRLVDTGGQPEFRKLAPLLVPGPSITFIVFRLNDDFNTILISRYCPSSIKKEVEYASYFCLRETIKEIINNIYCTELATKLKGSIMFIGTHKDCLDETKREQIIENKNDELAAILNECPHYVQDMVIKSDEKQIIFCVDNTVLELEHKCIKSKILSLCQSERFKIKAQPEQLLLALTLKGAKKVVLTMSEYQLVANECGVREIDMQNTLSLLQDKMLLVRKIESKNGEIIIIVKPRILINKISCILQRIILNYSLQPELRMPFISIVELREIALEGNKCGESIQPDMFINILINLLLIAPVIDRSGSVNKYIVPSMIPSKFLEGKKEDSIIPSRFGTSSLEVKSDDVLFTFQSFDYSIPSVLHSLVLCYLLQTSQWQYDVTRLPEVTSFLLMDTKTSFPQLIEQFQECLSIRKVIKPLKPLTVLLRCADTEIAVNNAFVRATKLVGYGPKFPTKHCPRCFHHYVLSAVLENQNCCDPDPVPEDVICFFNAPPMSDERAQEIIDRALEACSLDMRNLVAVITGLMGSGKTWLLSRLFNQLPPELYTSTGVAEASIRILLHRLTNVSANSWEPFSRDQIQQLLARLFQLRGVEPSASVAATPASPSSSLPPTSQQSSSTAWTTPAATPAAQSSRGTPKVSPASLPSPAAKSSTMQSMVRLVKTAKNSSEVMEMLELVHMIDTGGQPELLESVPSLIHHCHLAILVLNLMFGLDEHPSIDYHEKGKTYKRSSPSQYSNRQIMQKLASTLQAKRFSQSKGQCFRLLVVATHKDCVPQGELPARVKAFDQVLRDILLPACEKELISFSASQIPFVLNLKEPDWDDLKRLYIIRSEVRKSDVGEVVRTPGAFLVFEQELMELAKKKDPTRGILSLSECQAIGARLKMKQEDVEAALIFFDRQFTLLYFRKLLPNLVFTRPQTPLDCINAVVKFSYKVGSGEFMGITQKHVSSLKDGIITEEIFWHKELTQCFIPGLYEPQHAIKLLCHTFTLAPLSRDVQPTSDAPTAVTSSPTPSIKREKREKREYLMMSLRSAVPDKDVPRYLPSPSEIAQLVIQFTNKCVPLSCFSRTVSCLLAMYDWKLSRDDNGAPLCLAHNIVSLYKPCTPGQIVLVDTGHNFQVYIRPGKGLDGKDMATICYQVKETILAAIKKVFSLLSFTGIEATAAFFCPCKKKPLLHSATPSLFNSKWLLICSLTEQSVGPASDHLLLWLDAPVTETEKPSLPKLLDLEVVEKIGTEYKKFGTFLLKDDTGFLVNDDCLGMTHGITRKILQEWLAGKGEPVTWACLVKTLRRCKLNALADEIQQQHLT